MKLNNKLLYSAILFLLFCFNIQAQNNAVTLKGIVKFNDTYLQDINVINKNTGKGTSTNQKGNYYIKASLGDSILYSSVIYENRTIKITKTHINSKSIIVYLEADYNLLEEVFLVKKRIPNSIDIAIEKGTVLDNDKVTNRKPPDARKLTDPNAKSASINFIGIYNLFKKKSRKKRKLEKIEQDKILQIKKDLPETLIVRFGELFFKEKLYIKEHQINLFLEFCESKGLNELYDSSEIVIINFLVKKAKKFNELQNN